MGSEFCSFEEASKRLGCSKRTIHNYVKHGYLKKSVQAGEVMLRRSEVEQLASSWGTDLPTFNKRNFALLMTRVQRLEQDMALCRRILEIRESPLRPSKEEAMELWKAAAVALSVNSWRDDEIEMWAGLFDRLDEISLDCIKEGVLVGDPFDCFYKLCLAQMKSVSTRKEFSSSLSLQMLHKKLDEGRKNLRTSILMWARLEGVSLTAKELDNNPTDKSLLFKTLVGRKANRSTPLG